MAKIAISNLNSAGTDLFMDSESYMRELSAVELDNLNIKGGIAPLAWVAARYLAGAAMAVTFAYMGSNSDSNSDSDSD